VAASLCCCYLVTVAPMKDKFGSDQRDRYPFNKIERNSSLLQTPPDLFILMDCFVLDRFDSSCAACSACVWDEESTECCCDRLPPPQKFPPRSSIAQDKASYIMCQGVVIAFKRQYCKIIGQQICKDESADWSQSARLGRSKSPLASP
jgi:hypothetical protein